MLEKSHRADIELHHNIQLKTILLVDDEAVIRDLCSRALKGYAVIQAENGQEALTLFEKGGIDVVLTDVMMPGMDGIELLKRLKQKEPTIVVIVMTGFAEKDVILKALKEDADDFIAKPLNLLQLKTAVNKALVKKELKEEVASLKSLDRLKSNFLSTISHKFRTPLTSISLFLQNLTNGVYLAEDPEFRKNTRMISAEAAYLESLVADLLLFSRMMDTDAALHLEAVSLPNVIHKIMGESREIAAKPAIEAILDLAEVPSVKVDIKKIEFSIKQIIDNAYKFSGEEGEVSIALRSDSTGIFVEVRDNGPGIASDELPKIFEKFYQTDPHNTGQVRGFGLGLHYAREFVRMHGGSIAVESALGRGCKVTVRLPDRKSVV